MIGCVLVAIMLCFPGQGPSGGTPWSKIEAALWMRIQGNDLSDRSQAMQEVIATKDSRAFDLLGKALSWAIETQKSVRGQETEEKKKLSALRDDLAQRTKIRDALLAKKKLSLKDSQRLQELNSEIGGLNQSVQEAKRELEKKKGEIASLEQVERLAQEGFASLLRDCPPGFFDPFHKALASALGLPGSTKHGILYVQVLVQSRRKESYAPLEGILKAAQGSDAFLLAAAKGMTAVSGREAIAQLIDFLAFPNASVRKAAHGALKEATGQSLAAEKLAWEKWFRQH